MSKLSETKEKILEIAKKEIAKKGFNYFSYQDISEILGIKKASIHYHFPSKNLLGKAILDKYIYDFGRLISINEDKNALQKLNSYFNAIGSFVENYDSICPSGVFSADFFTLEEELQNKLNEFFNLQKNWLQTIILQGKKEGVFKKSIDENTFSVFILSVVQGSIQITRNTKEQTIFQNTISQIKDILNV